MRNVLAFPYLTNTQWDAIAATLPDGADLVRTRAALDRLVIDRHRYELKDHTVRRRALCIWADAGGDDRTWAPHPTPPKGLRPSRARKSERKGPAISYLQTISRELLNHEFPAESANTLIRHVWRRARSRLQSGGDLSVDATALASAAATLAGAGKLTVDATVLPAAP
jgi:hypothetical protein